MNFSIGCNYWASNAGMYMWRRFDEDVIARDLDMLTAEGVDTIRIFPLWPDFQPVTDALVGSHHTHHLRVNDQPLATPAGLDPLMLERFGRVLDMAEERGLKVIVALITGWMSGRLFVPPLLMNKNPLTDPLAVVWECKFIREFIPHFKDRDCIVAWEPGNECNCLTTALRDRAITPEQAELWLSAITGAIRSSDSSRPIYAGLYINDLDSPWSVTMTREYVDMQTTHPYPLFTPFCSKESILTMRSALHSAAQSAMYMGVTDQPCLVEEIGTLGATVLSDDYSAEYLEKSLFSSLQYDTSGYLWWCGFDQDKFDFPPYDGAAVEQTLGLAYSDGKPKEILRKMGEMSRAVKAVGELSPAKKDAVVILCDPENSWKHSYGAFCLAAQAGATVEFSYKSGRLKDSDRYIIPSLGKDTQLKFIYELIEKIEAGAKLLITYDGGHTAPFERLTGLRVRGREMAGKTFTFELSGKRLTVPTEKSLVFTPAEAEVLARSGEDIVLTKHRLGKGEVYFLNAPLECAYTTAYKPYESELCEVYKLFFGDVNRPLTLDTALASVTYHECDAGEVKVLITKYTDETIIGCSIGDGYKVKATYNCDFANNSLQFKGNYAYILLCKG